MSEWKRTRLKIVIRGLVSVMAFGLMINSALAMARESVRPHQIIDHYVTMAHAVFQDSLITARDLSTAVDSLLKKPSEERLAQVKVAWRTAREPYLQSEVFRFGNANVDDWEGRVNAWPLDEGLIDYVRDYHHEIGNEGATANLIASSLIQVGGETVSLKRFTPSLIAKLHELGGSEANVASGYHAIEFLLWGQDLNTPKGAAGQRPFRDYATGQQCTGGHCDRRREYLQAVTQLLVQDLEEMVSQWRPGVEDNYAATFRGLPEKEALKRILYGMGSLSLGELAGERMKVALEANSMEDEQDCFSDNTHNAHYFNGKGVKNIYFGRYTRVSGDTLQGPSLAQWLSQDKALAKVMDDAFAKSERQLKRMVEAATGPEPMAFDQMIAPGNSQGEAMIKQAIAALVNQAQAIQQLAAALDIQNLNPDTAEHTFD